MAAGSNFVICLVDEAPPPLQYFLTENIPESAPTYKGASGNPQQTSVTEFKDFDKNEMYTTSFIQGARSGYTSENPVTNQVSEKRHIQQDEKVMYKKTMKVFSA